MTAGVFVGAAARVASRFAVSVNVGSGVEVESGVKVAGDVGVYAACVEARAASEVRAMMVETFINAGVFVGGMGLTRLSNMAKQQRASAHKKHPPTSIETRELCRLFFTPFSYSL